MSLIKTQKPILFFYVQLQPIPIRKRNKPHKQKLEEEEEEERFTGFILLLNGFSDL